MPADTLILASLSKFRADILKNAGLHFTVQAAKINERDVEENNGPLSPSKTAIILAKAKAEDVSLRFPNALVIGCDQILSFEDKIFHKATSMEEARQRLLTLSGKTHHLHSAIAIAKNGKILWSDVSVAHLTMRKLASDYIGRYLACNDETILLSVGVYQIEKEGIQLFDTIEGDYFTIIGLPLLLLLKQLRIMGVIDG